MKIHEVIAVIEAIAPPTMAAAWDKCGVQVASHREKVHCVALCLDPTPQSVRRAVDLGAQVIVSHHPLLLKGRLPDKLDAYHEVLRTLFINDVTLYAAHTSLDVSVTGGKSTRIVENEGQTSCNTMQHPFQGPAAWLLRELGLQHGAVLDLVSSDDILTGYGLVGDMPKPSTFTDIVQCLHRHIDMSTATVCGEIPSNISRVAYCTGSGSSLAEKAAAQGADIFITGDVKYHSALESPLCMLDVGHHGLEEEMMRRFVSLLESRLPEISVVFVPSESPLRNALSCAS